MITREEILMNDTPVPVRVYIGWDSERYDAAGRVVPCGEHNPYVVVKARSGATLECRFSWDAVIEAVNSGGTIRLPFADEQEENHNGNHDFTRSVCPNGSDPRIHSQD